eukprot:11262028-Karenia_brevis.AAC.1
MVVVMIMVSMMITVMVVVMMMMMMMMGIMMIMMMTRCGGPKWPAQSCAGTEPASSHHMGTHLALI